MVAEAPLTVEEVVSALVVPFGAGRARGIARPAGVFDGDGLPVRRARCLRDLGLKVTTTPPLPDPAEGEETLSGTWLFGGMLYAHFGHFLCESTARLWALDRPGPPVAGVLFHPRKRATWPRRFLRPIRPWLALAGVEGPVELPMRPCRVERLLVPDQAFGTGGMIGGRPEFHRFVRERFGAGIAAEGAERIYISRSRLFARRGRILGEAWLEARMQAEGYRIFHPQEHPIEAQVAQYKAARVVVSTDCSALHLAAFFARPGDRVAIVLRRPGRTVQDFVTQYRTFCGVEPVVIDCLCGLHSYEGAKLGQMSEVFGEIDPAALQAALVAAGFLTGPAQPGPTPDGIAAELEDLAARLGARPLRLAAAEPGL